MYLLKRRYAYNHEPDKALEYNLRLRRPNVFDLIRDYNLFSAVQDKVVLLMDFDQHLMSEEKKKLEMESENSEQDPENKNGPVKKSRPKKATEMPAVQLLVENTESVQVCINI